MLSIPWAGKTDTDSSVINVKRLNIKTSNRQRFGNADEVLGPKDTDTATRVIGKNAT